MYYDNFIMYLITYKCKYLWQIWNLESILTDTIFKQELWFMIKRWLTREEVIFFAVLCGIHGDYGYVPDKNIDYSSCDIKYK